MTDSSENQVKVFMGTEAAASLNGYVVCDRPKDAPHQKLLHLVEIDHGLEPVSLNIRPFQSSDLALFELDAGGVSAYPLSKVMVIAAYRKAELEAELGVSLAGIPSLLQLLEESERRIENEKATTYDVSHWLARGRDAESSDEA